MHKHVNFIIRLVRNILFCSRYKHTCYIFRVGTCDALYTAKDSKNVKMKGLPMTCLNIWASNLGKYCRLFNMYTVPMTVALLFISPSSWISVVKVLILKICTLHLDIILKRSAKLKEQISFIGILRSRDVIKFIWWCACYSLCWTWWHLLPENLFCLLDY